MHHIVICQKKTNHWICANDSTMPYQYSTMSLNIKTHDTGNYSGAIATYPKGVDRNLKTNTTKLNYVKKVSTMDLTAKLILKLIV